MSYGTDVLDMSEFQLPSEIMSQMSMDEWRQRWKEEGQRKLQLGSLTDVVLSADCPLCRLMFYIFPREEFDFSEEGLDYHLEPILAYDLVSFSRPDPPL
jgi:hypothetical protein